MDDLIHERLVDIARSRETTYYSDIAPLANLDMSLPVDRNRIAQILGEISTYEHHQGRPLLSAVVILKDENIPGEGFFSLAYDLSLYNGGDKDTFWLRELYRVWDCWKS